MILNGTKPNGHRKAGWLCAAVALALAGCFTTPVGERARTADTPADDSTIADYDSAAIVAVVQDLYQQAGEGRTVFLGADGDGVGEQPAFGDARSRLAADLQASVRPLSERMFRDPINPVDPATGEVGFTVVLGRFSVDEDGALHVNVSYGQAVRPYRTCTEYELARSERGWSVIDTSHGCTSSGQTLESYDRALERVRSGRCSGISAAMGTCGSWWYIIETTGYTGHRSYYDPETGEIIALQAFTDAGPVFDWFVFGDVNCALERPDETAPCGLLPTSGASKHLRKDQESGDEPS